MNDVPFRSMLRAATGGTEVWTDHYETQKMSQYGWRCTTNEDHYETGTLIGNYNEERFDLKEIKKNKPLPSLFAHYYQPTYAVSYNKNPLHRYPADLRRLRARLPHAYSVHQPELDTPQLKAYTNSWMTTQRASYLHPQLRLQPIKSLPDEKGVMCPGGHEFS
ncbi:cilia- and flagella-associated protein 68-like [Physella acuta]|uniref:cilia- and flagella-associated protein 68-like n=1 Tax=Physella acuta TaxID=109671 RepID=UPI0027DDED70|nr:cilia- and flagella-associated protein 68-like [Physella acuta]